MFHVKQGRGMFHVKHGYGSRFLGHTGAYGGVGPLQKLTTSLSQNIAALQAALPQDALLRVRRFQCGAVQLALLFEEAMADSTHLARAVVQPLQGFTPPFAGPGLLQVLQARAIFSAESTPAATVADAIAALLRGDGVLLAQGDGAALCIGAKGFAHRAVDDPPGEPALQGPREGFTEVLNVNLSLVRRRLPTADLRMVPLQLGQVTQTRVCLLYLQGKALPEVVSAVRTRLAQVQLESVVDANYLLEYLRPRQALPFNTVGASERPDVLCANLLEGRVALLVDGSPTALWVPCLFSEYFQSSDDYYINPWYALSARVLRFGGFLMACCVPAIYLALTCYHQDLLPVNFLISLMKALQGIPFSAVAEELFLLLIFELLREAGFHSPSSISQSLSIVGGIVLGQSAVEARLISAPMVIMVALTGVAGLMLPQTKSVTLLVQLFLFALAACFGLYGVTVGILALCIHLSAMQSYGVPYLHGMLPTPAPALLDYMLRAPWPKMGTRRTPLPGRAQQKEAP